MIPSWLAALIIELYVKTYKTAVVPEPKSPVPAQLIPLTGIALGHMMAPPSIKTLSWWFSQEVLALIVEKSGAREALPKAIARSQAQTGPNLKRRRKTMSDITDVPKKVRIH